MSDGADRSSKEDEARLVGRARQGDLEAFGRLVRRNQDYVYNAVYHLVSSPQDAEDIAQEVFMRAYDRLDGFEGRARFSTWLYGIMLNAVRTHWRRRARRRTLSLDGAPDDGPSADLPDRSDGPPAEAERRERVHAVRAAIAELDDGMREVLVLRDIQGLSYEELAAAMRLPAGTVKSRLHRARLALRKRLEPLYGLTE